MPSTEAPISINLKSAGGTGITLRAETAEEFADMIANGIHVIADAVKEVETAIKGASPVMSTQDIAASLGASIINENPVTQSIGGRNCPHETNSAHPRRAGLCPLAAGGSTNPAHSS